jgi:hypothetical protein
MRKVFTDMVELDDDFMSNLRKIVRFAEANPIIISKEKVIKDGLNFLPTDMAERTIVFPGDMKVVFSIDEIAGVLMRHISFTIIDKYNANIHPRTLKEVSRLFGFDHCCPLHTRHFVVEFEPGKLATHVMEKYEKKLLN